MSSNSQSSDSQPSTLTLLRVWLSLGLQSFGGGLATLALIRRAVVEQRGWLTEADFARDWSLVQLAPGINLLALTILIGRRTGGVRGICLSLAGLLLPSVAVTILLTAFYARVQGTPLVREALCGVIPAIVGLGLVTAWQIARPLLSRSRREGRGSLSLSLLLLAGSGLAVWRAHLPVIAVLVVSGAIYAFWNWQQARQRDAAP